MEIRAKDNTLLATVEADTLAGVDLSRKQLQARPFCDLNEEQTEDELRDVDLYGASLRGVDLMGADLSRTQLCYADLVGANLEGANLSNSMLIGAEFHRANLSDANLSGSFLEGADLRGARLSNADLSNADLLTADLGGATLLNADLSGAKLFDARMLGTNLAGVNLEGAELDTGETWEIYLRDVVPALLTAGGKELSMIAATWHWQEWDWPNHPIKIAFDLAQPTDYPPLFAPRIMQFMRFFEAGLIPRPVP